MIVAALLLLAAPTVDDDAAKTFAGSCAYEGNDPEARDETLVRCDYLIVKALPNGLDVLFTFGEAGGDVVSFAGPIISDTDVKVDRVQLKPGVDSPAAGKCRKVLDNDGVFRRLACIANVAGRFYAGRFEVRWD